MQVNMLRQVREFFRRCNPESNVMTSDARQVWLDLCKDLRANPAEREQFLREAAEVEAMQ